MIPGLSLYDNIGTINVKPDNKSIGINKNNLLYIREGGISRDMMEFTGFNVEAGTGVNITGNNFIEIGGIISVEVDVTVIRTNIVYQIMNGNIKLGNDEESTGILSGSIILQGGAGISGNVNTGGEVTAGEINVSSDIRLKKEISTLENSLDTINNIQACSYKWRKRKGRLRNDKLNYGVLAQQLEEIGLGFMVKTGIFKSVNYNQLIPLLISGLQELDKEINEIEEEIKTLK